MRRGFGEALTRRAIACAPGAPAVLQPSSEGYATYRRLGFAEIGGFTNWIFETPGDLIEGCPGIGRGLPRYTG